MFKRHNKFSPLIVAFAAGAVILLLSISYTVNEHRNMVSHARTDAQNTLSVYRSRLETNLYSRLFLTKTLAGYVSNHPDINQSEFESMVMEVIKNDRAINSISLSKNSVITYIYPIKGHEAAIGLDLTAHPERREMVGEIIRRRIGYVQGPVTLVEGGEAIIMYTPIYLASGKKMGDYWGLSDIVIFTDNLFKEAGFLDEVSGLDFAVRGKDGKGAEGEIFWGDKKVYQSGPVYQTITLPSGSWQLAAVPKEGWPTFRRELILTMLAGVLLSLLCGIVTYIIMREPKRLIEEIDERKRVEVALRESEHEMKRHRDNLEKIVEERTESIVKMNEQLRHEIAERKEMDIRLQDLSARMLSAHESERKRLSRELHDGLGQSLLAVRMKLQMLKADLAENSGTLKEGINESISDISATINELREISMALRPSHLEDSDMDDILAWHGKRFEESSGIKTAIDAEKISGLSLKVKENLFRIFQEALNNIAKHSGADRVKIELRRDDGRLRMTVSDNGHGIKQDMKGGMAGGIGLFTMRERALLMDGEFTIDSLPRAGTTIVIEAPIT